MSTNNYSFVGDQRQRLTQQRKAVQTAPGTSEPQAVPTATDAATTLTDREQIAQSIDQQLAKIDSTFNANKEKWAAQESSNTYRGPMGMFAQPSQFTVAAIPEEQKQLEAARMELSKARKALNTYTENDQAQDVEQGREKGFFEEIGTGLKNTTFGDVASIFTLGYSDTQNTSKINAALRKASQGGELTDIERSMVEAVGQTQKAQKYVQDNGGGTILSSIGEGIPTTAGYMLETGVFGGNMLSAARNAATKGAAAFGKAILKEAAVEAVRTPFRGSMTSKIVDLDTDQYSVQDDGSVVKGDPSSFAERLWKGYASTFAEGFSERIGNVIPSNLVGRGLGRVVPKLMGAKAGAAVTGATDALAANTKQFRDFMRKATGYNGTVDEFLEEEFNNLIEPLLTLEPERIKDNFTLKNQAITLGSVAVMGATMHTMSLPSTIAVASDKSKMRRGINASVNSIEIPTLRQEVYNVTKKGVTIEDRAKDLANLDWANMSVADRANTIDAFNKSIVLDVYSGFELSRKTDEMTAQKIQTWNAIYQQSANTDTGAIEELADEQDNRYLLLAGSLEDQGTDETLFVRNAQTGMTEQIGRSSVRRVGEAETYESGLRKIVEQSAKQASEQILDDQSAEEDQDAQEIGVQPVAYNVGDNVTLADGRQGQFLGYHNDGSNIAQVAFVDQQTGEQESAEVPKSHIVGFAYQDDVSQAEPAQELPNVEQSEQSENAQQEAPSENVQQEIPTTKDGEPDYDAMPADMYLAEYSKVASLDEALEDLRNEKIAIEKQIKKLRSGDNAISRNTKIANRAKVANLQAKVDDIGRVLQENTPEQSSEMQIEQAPQGKVTLKESMLNLGDYISVEDYILRDIASGLKFRWSDDGASRGLATELGLKGSDQERKSRIGIIRDNGTTPDKYAESISGLLGNSIPAFSVDEQDIRNAVIDVLGSVSSPAQAAAKVKALHSNGFDEQAEDYYLGEIEKYKLEVAEYDAALDLWVNELLDEDFAEINALFEFELLTLRDQNTNNDGYKQTDSRRASAAQDATIETSQDQSRQGGDNDPGGDQKIDFRGETKEADAGQDDDRVEDPILSAQTQEQKYEAIKVYVDHLNQLSGADAVVFSRLEQLPDAVAIEFEAQWRAEPNQETPGVTIGTKVYLYAPHIKDAADLEVVFNHEVAAHRNVLLALGQDRKAEANLYSAIVDDVGVPKMLQLIDDSVFSELADMYFENPARSSKIELGKEFVGYFTEKHFNKKEYSNVGAGKLSLNLSEKITIKDVINILNTANSKGNEQRITIENSRNGVSQLAYEADDTRNMGQDRARQASDLAGRGSNIVLAPENTTSDLSGIQKNPTHSKNTNGGSTESDSNSGTEIRQEDVRRAGGTEQTDGTTDAFEQTVKGDEKNIGAKSISDKKILSKDEYLKSRLNELYHNAESSNNTITREIWEDSEEYISIYNDVVDSYENYIIELSDSGLLQKIYDEASFYDEIKIRNNIKATSLSINDLLNTEPKRLLRKEQKDRQNAINRRERLSKISNDIRYRQIESDNTVETEQIRQQTIERGDFLKAPNGEPTNLTERQWLQVRTAAFKEWFGDWEKAARIEKLRKAESVEITGNEITPSDDLKQYKRNALEYGKTLRGEYVNKDTGEKIVLHRGAVKEVLNHDYKDFEHLQSIAAIPQIIEQSIYITTASNEDVFTNPDVASYDYYVCGLNVGDLDYTVRAVVATKSDGKRYYDHKLSAIEKGKLIEKLTPYAAFAPSGLSSTVGSEESTPFRPADKSGETSKISPVSDFKDKRLLSILQTNSSKVVDENGEPQVVYHGTRKDFTTFDTSAKAPTGIGSFFTDSKEYAQNYAGNIDNRFAKSKVFEVFLNMRNPFNYDNAQNKTDFKENYIDKKTTSEYDGMLERTYLEANYDGEVRENRGVGENDTYYIAFSPNQVKSAIENTGDFSANSDDIRYSDQSLLSETQTQHEYEQNKANTYVNAEKRKAQVVEQLQKLTEKFGVDTVIVNNTKELPQSVRYRTRNARFGGLYDKQDGKVYFVASEIRDVDDATATFLHEVVSHKGIDALMGRQRADKFYVAVFDSLPQEERARLLAKYGDKVLAGDELVARMAEGDVTPSVMQRLIAAVRKFFREVLGLDLTISDNDIRYVLWKSKNNLERASTLGQVFSVIERDKALRSELYPPNKSLMDQVRDTSLRYRTVKPFVATDKKGNEYLRVSGEKGSVPSLATQTSEKFVDQYVKVKYLVDEVRRRGGDVNILNNVYDELNLKDSKASAATDHYADDFFEPLMNHFKHLGKYKFQYKQISDYINAKSSVERDESGTSALGKDPKGKWTKSTAQKIVNKFETVVEEQDVAKLWDLWRSATSQSLQVAANSGRIALSELKQIQSKDWQYYAPLRGKDFDFEGVQDMREVFYLNSNQRYSNTDISKAEVTKRALGRTSKAADPVAALIHMTNQEIYLSQENKALRYLLRLVEANIEMKDLFELKKVYYEKIGDDWVELEGTPDRAKMEATHNARLAIMRYHKELSTTSNVDLMDDLIEKISAEQDKITITSREAEAKHKGYTGASKYAGDVAIMKDGVKYIVQIKDPEVAGAINYKPDGLQRGLSNTMGRGTRFMGMMKTSKNPAFIGSNKARDFMGGAFYNYVHRDGDLKGFLKHSEMHYGAISRRIKGKASLLDVAQLGGRNILDRTDRSVLAKIYGKKQVEDTIYDLFVLSGGLTGYFHNPDVKEHQKKSERNIKRKSKRYYLGKGLNSLNKGIDYLSEVAENSTRFAAFMAQIDNGANVPSAIKHAKNVSVNFNRKGRYSKGIGAAILFFNATMQGVKRLYDLFMGEADYTNRERWAQRGRFALATVVGASIGYWSTVMVKSMLRGLIGDDDQEYMVSLYERCTNLLIPVSGTKGGYVKIPIDISLRPAYGLGVLLSDWQDGLISKQDVVDNFLQIMAANVYPIDINIFNPIGLKGQILEAITPSIIEPLADIGNNRDFTGNTIFREAPYSPHTPQSQLGKRNANVYLVNFTKWLNEFFGGNEFTPAGVNIDGTFNWRNMFDLNPSKLEHIFSQYFAGVGKTANDLIVTLSSIKNGTDIEARKIPIANRFYGEAYEKDPSREYYDIKKNIERVNRNNKKAKELGVRSAIFTEDEFSTKYVEYKKYGQAIKELERKTRPIKEKLGQMQFGSQEYDLLEAQIDKLHRKFIKQYNDQRD